MTGARKSKKFKTGKEKKGKDRKKRKENRNGGERKGKEWDIQDTTGKERKGKEMTGKERKGKGEGFPSRRVRTKERGNDSLRCPEAYVCCVVPTTCAQLSNDKTCWKHSVPCLTRHITQSLWR